MIVRSKFPAVSIPEDVTYPELMLNKFDQYGDRVAMVGFIGVCIGPGVLIYCTNTYVHPEIYFEDSKVTVLISPKKILYVQHEKLN